MSRIVGEGDAAVLVAGGAESPAAPARDVAARELLLAFYLYGHRDRGWNGCAYRALEALHPQAARMMSDLGPRAALECFYPEELAT